MSVVVSEAEWRSINEMKRRWEAHTQYERVKQAKRRAQKKVERGLDPDLDVRANQRPGETDEEHAKRLDYNRKQKEWRDEKKRRIGDGVWQARPKLSKEAQREKKNEYLRVWRLNRKG